jgi:mannose-6-phosphate isomerase-like protein (cupin superfamily)
MRSPNPRDVHKGAQPSMGHYLQKISLREKLDSFDETWAPKIVARVNEFALKLVKLNGDFIWHHHDADDEAFIVLAGRISMHYRLDGEQKLVEFGPGELLVVPRGIEHKPSALPGTELLLVERAGLPNTGNERDSDRTATPQAI